MTPDEIMTALGAHLGGMDDCPSLVVPGFASDLPAYPYLTVQMATRADHDPALAGGAEYSTGTFGVVVVTEINTGTMQANTIAAAVKARFPKATLTGGVRITGSQVLAGYSDDVSWRVPVVVDWIAV